MKYDAGCTGALLQDICHPKLHLPLTKRVRLCQLKSGRVEPFSLQLIQMLEIADTQFAATAVAFTQFRSSLYKETVKSYSVVRCRAAPSESAYAGLLIKQDRGLGQSFVLES